MLFVVLHQIGPKENQTLAWIKMESNNIYEKMCKRSNTSAVKYFINTLHKQISQELDNA